MDTRQEQAYGRHRRYRVSAISRAAVIYRAIRPNLDATAGMPIAQAQLKARQIAAENGGGQTCGPRPLVSIRISRRTGVNLLLTEVFR